MEQIHDARFSEIRHLPMIDFIGNDFAIFDDIKDIPLGVYPTRLNAVCLAVCRKGYCRVSLDLQEYEVREGMLCIILPHQIVQLKGRSDDFVGNYIVVSQDFSDMVIPAVQQLFPILFLVRKHPCIPITEEELQTLCEYHAFLWSKVKLKDNAFRKEITRGLLLALFYEVYNIYRAHTPPEYAPANRKQDILERFLHIVPQYYRQERSVMFYAGKLCVSPKHLSTVIKEASGKRASEWIDDFVILEAKALLKSSELSIQEIADELHFANQSFFGKYFKQHTGMSPKEYRKR